MKDDKTFTSALSWIIGGGAVLCICYMLGTFLGVTKDDAPAWVQAIGSIVAIGAAAILTQNQASNERSLEQTRRNLDKIHRFESVRSIMAAIYSVSTTIKQEIEERKFADALDGSLAYLVSLDEAIKAIPLLEIPGNDHTVMILSLYNSGSRLAMKMHEFTAAIPAGDEARGIAMLTDIFEDINGIRSISFASKERCEASVIALQAILPDEMKYIMKEEVPKQGDVH